MWHWVRYGKKKSSDSIVENGVKLSVKGEYIDDLADFWERKCKRGELIIKQLLIELNLLKEKVSKLSNEPKNRLVQDYWAKWQEAESRFCQQALLSDSRLKEVCKLDARVSALIKENAGLKEGKAVLTIVNDTFKVLVCKGNTEVEKLQAELNKLKEENKRLAKENTIAKKYIGERSSDMGKLRQEIYRLKRAGKCSCTICTKFAPMNNCRCKEDSVTLQQFVDWYLDGHPKLYSSELGLNGQFDELPYAAWEDMKNNKKPTVDGCGCKEPCDGLAYHCINAKWDRKNKNQCKNSIPQCTSPTTTASLTLKLQIYLKGPPLTTTTVSYLQGLGWVVDTQHVTNKVTNYKLTYVKDQTSIAGQFYDLQALLSVTTQSLRQAGY